MSVLKQRNVSYQSKELLVVALLRSLLTLSYISQDFSTYGGA